MDDRQEKRLSAATKSVYAIGDFTVNTALASLSLIFASYYLIEVVGMRPLLAGLVPLIGRAVDAFTDPAMGRLSDVTRTMREHGVRRLPILDPEGRLAGLIALDDVISLLGRELADVAGTVGEELEHERRIEALREELGGGGIER